MTGVGPVTGVGPALGSVLAPLRYNTVISRWVTLCWEVNDVCDLNMCLGGDCLVT